MLGIRDYFTKQPTLVHITVPKKQKFTICGDVHGNEKFKFYKNFFLGQFYDLCNIFEINGFPSETNPYVNFLY